MMIAMCCLVLAVLLIGPRLGLVLLFLFTHFISRAYHGLLLPVLGFIFLPWTTLYYAWLVNSGHSVAGLYLIGFVVAVIVDLGAHGGGLQRGRG